MSSNWTAIFEDFYKKLDEGSAATGLTSEGWEKGFLDQWLSNRRKGKPLSNESDAAMDNKRRPNGEYECFRCGKRGHIAKDCEEANRIV